MRQSVQERALVCIHTRNRGGLGGGGGHPCLYRAGSKYGLRTTTFLGTVKVVHETVTGKKQAKCGGKVCTRERERTGRLPPSLRRQGHEKPAELFPSIQRTRGGRKRGAFPQKEKEKRIKGGKLHAGRGESLSTSPDERHQGRQLVASGSSDM